MNLFAEISGKTYRVDMHAADISIPLDFYGSQPNTYGLPVASSAPFEGGGFVGDVRRGGSCNFETVTLTAHCNGTHTECVGHITEARISVHQRLEDTFIPATLISVFPERAVKSQDTYRPQFNADDLVITRNSMAEALAHANRSFLDALIIRTLPNEESKKSRDYMKKAPPFFSIEAMEMIRSYGVRHLLIDMPSVDRLFDEGILVAHHIFWEAETPHGEPGNAESRTRTITEMIYVSDNISDGSYLLNLQIAPFVSDASPSRPRLFSVYRE
ncbi:MAG: cyclase family protein [Bacteroidia bacterium]